MWKYIKYLLITLVLLLIIGGFIGVRKFNSSLFGEKPNLLTYTHDSKPISFIWASDSIGGIFEKHAAMLIPTKIDGLSHQLHMQFDTGSPYSFIYEKDLNSLKALGVEFKEIIQDEVKYVDNINLELGGNKINVRMIKILKYYGNTFSEKDTIHSFTMGTIGNDFIDKKITTINFQNQLISTYAKRPNWMDTLPDFKGFDFKGRRIMLPAIVDGKDLELLYDSGTSAFGIITTKNRFKRYTDEKTELIEYGANSWGSSIPMVSKHTNKELQIGNTKLSMERASYVDMYAWTQRFVTPFTRIGGWLGNRPFIESTLILDTQKEEFVIIKSTRLNENL